MQRKRKGWDERKKETRKEQEGAEYDGDERKKHGRKEWRPEQKRPKDDEEFEESPEQRRHEEGDDNLEGKSHYDQEHEDTDTGHEVMYRQSVLVLETCKRDQIQFANNMRRQQHAEH